MSQRNVPVVLNQPLPRRTQATYLVRLPATILAAVFVGLVLVATLPIYSRFHRLETLKHEGISTDGEITDLTQEHGRNDSISYRVDYRFFAAPSSGGSQTAHQAKEYVDVDTYRWLFIGRTVAVVYAPLDAEQSALNIGNVIRTTNNYVGALKVYAIMFAICAGLYVVMIPFTLGPYLREKKLLRWGKIAPAEIVEDYEERSGRMPLSRVTYRFRDGTGNTVQGIRDGLAQKQYRTAAVSIDMLENPTVLYDPKDSRKNLLYPPKYVVCLSRQGDG
jgi:hypothetical protein